MTSLKGLPMKSSLWMTTRSLTVAALATMGCGSEAVGGAVEIDSGATTADTGAAADSLDPWADTAELFPDTGVSSGDTAVSLPDAPLPDAPVLDAPDAPGGALPTFITKRSALVFSDNFSSGSFKPDWQVVGGIWSVVDQHLVGSQPTGENDPNIGRSMPVDRVVIQFAFRLGAAGRAGIRLNAKSADPQHLVNVSVAETAVTLSEMSGWASSTKSNKLQTTPVKLTVGKWYTGVFEIFGNDVAFGIDGKLVVSGTTVDQSATPRNHFVLQAYGDEISYDDVSAWQATKK